MSELELRYDRCDGDPIRLIMAEVGQTLDGTMVTVGIPEIASALALKSATYTITMAMKGGVTEDFNLRTALAFGGQIASDVHAIVPVMDILGYTLALFHGARVQYAGGDATCPTLKLINTEKCPDWLQWYFRGVRSE